MRLALFRRVRRADIERVDDRLDPLNVSESVHSEEFVDTRKRHEVSGLWNDGAQERDELRSRDVFHGDDLADKLGIGASFSTG